jgi:head-tail adaptor
MKCSCPTPPKPYTHTLTVQKPDPNAVENDDGQIDIDDAANWVDVGRIRARFLTKSGRESSRTETEAHQQVHATSTVTIYAPSTATTRAIDPSWRLKLGTRVFEIVASYLINETGREVQITAMERRQP